MTPVLYRRILGTSFDKLPVVLQRFHERPEAHARGRFEIKRGQGTWCRLVATMMGLPPEGTDVPVELHVTTDGRRERWNRDFRGFKMETVQSDKHGMLIEASGPMQFEFDVKADESSMNFTSRRARFIFIPLPRWSTPSVTAVVKSCNAGWSVDVQIHAPIVGLLVRYAGVLTPDESP